MCAPEHSHRRPAQRGMSLVEVMVGMVVAMMVGLAATGGAAMFSASQRQGIGTGGALLNAGTALAALRDDAAAAGLGFFGDNQYLCHRLNLSVAAVKISDGAAFTPLNVTAETDGDRLDVVYATQVASSANVLLNAATTGASADLRSLLPVAVPPAPALKPTVLLAPDTPGVPCLVRSVTAVTASTDTTPQQLAFANTGSHNQAAFTTNPSFPDKGRVMLLGALRWSRYRLEGTDLRLERPLGGDPVVLARNVIGFRVQYGIADTGTTALASWQNASSAWASLTPALLPRVRALRIGLVTRSPQAEKVNAAGTCEATADTPQLFGADLTPDVSNWRCYRYRTAIVVVPLRNLVMGMAP
ncbi:Pilus assembly protein [Rubrivivax sp. A210]|uniref:PilW family protein n=1 Tax=Rubrivivax sp. A210 TaxID=2772301 RepID=UPI001918BDF7|nr:PilW family protein [Rubrivivax sp. A210]CAD5371835.1 Pilus assembly protein [Rubrivivax sp. A210]